MKHTFGKIVICHTNDFPAKKNDKIEDWVKNRGGKVVRELTNDVTHYVVSKRVWRENWQNGTPREQSSSFIKLTSCQIILFEQRDAKAPSTLSSLIGWRTA